MAEVGGGDTIIVAASHMQQRGGELRVLAHCSLRFSSSHRAGKWAFHPASPCVVRTLPPRRMYSILRDSWNAMHQITRGAGGGHGAAAEGNATRAR